MLKCGICMMFSICQMFVAKFWVRIIGSEGRMVKLFGKGRVEYVVRFSPTRMVSKILFGYILCVPVPVAARSKGFESHPGALMSVCCECCMLSGRGLCDELITRLEESYRLCCVVVCDLEKTNLMNEKAKAH
jgi:hypothetical protein